ncbi:MAG TPA: hypothetical protein VHW45_13275 [Candidatus Sulfotelmatobacter sp.]|jgi:hypothetical protein|nr:hypothetical protein [Candidatus Sulfotelmatobacter sp.]
MRFRIWLPIAQTVAMLWLTWSALEHGPRKFVLRAPDGLESTIPVHHAAPRALEWAQAINLPAVPIVTPLEFAFRRAQGLPNYRIQFYGCWLVGLLCYYMTGRFADEILRWWKMRILERAPRDGVMFALLALPSTILMAAAFGLNGHESRVISAWAIVWLGITSADFIFRVAQLIRHRRRPDFPRG